MKEEKNYSENITCGHCYNISKMELIGGAKNVTETWEDIHGPGIDFYDVYEILKCPKCNKANIRVYGWSDFADGEDEHIPTMETLYPIGDQVPRGLPAQIGKAYQAAELTKSIDINAYAILLRRLLELVCHDRKAKGGTLAKMLQDLATKNEIPQNLVEVANGLKNLGNIGAHAGSGELGEDEIPILKALANAILEYVYSAPELVNIVTKRLEEIKKKK